MSTVYVRFSLGAYDEDDPPSGEWATAPQRSPLLERLLARADSQVPVSNWRLDAYRCVTAASSAAGVNTVHPALVAAGNAAPPALAAAACFAQCGFIDAPWVCLATPVSYVAAMTTVRMAPGGVLRLSEADARQLAADFNATFLAGGQRLYAARDGAMFLSLDSPLEVDTQDPANCVGGEIGTGLPAGTDGARLRRLMSEIEMWLYDHALNAQRSARGELPISGLWLWGGGATLAELVPLPVWFGGRDPVFSAWSTRSESQPGPGSGIVVLETEPGTQAWSDAERHWLVPLLDELAMGRIAALELSAGGRRYSLSARWRRRWWRRWSRSWRPWWESFA